MIPIRNGWIQCPFLALMEQLVQISLTKNRPENIPPPQKRSSCSNHFLSSNSFPELSELSYTSWRCNYCDAQIQLHPTKPSFVLKVDQVIHCAVVGAAFRRQTQKRRYHLPRQKGTRERSKLTGFRGIIGSDTVAGGFCSSRARLILGFIRAGLWDSGAQCVRDLGGWSGGYWWQGIRFLICSWWLYPPSPS